ncbi:nuclease domain-containing protein [Methylobacterium planeticum]|uniref:Uncharacterized protein n=1 Tax=Methylobacterium planeticum TaxID=2615211 RepID=A0A6N6MKL9_9HYPH|nr:nuclease domain-containing protein [Methylobacterium planeticum]KAB1070730.1 hypothetical protein F6X51_21380 [Methylobacterium planeticum]
MSAPSLSRLVGGVEVPLDEGPEGFLCSEGDCVVVASRTAALPQLQLRGKRLVPESLQQADGDFEARFVYWIDSWAGRTSFSLSDGLVRHDITLDVGPHQEKLAPGGWDALIRELSDISQALPWGMSPGAAAGRLVDDGLVAVHPAIIEHQLPLLERLLMRLLAVPPTLVRRVRTVGPLNLSRGADLRTVRWLARRPLELAGVRGEAPADALPNPRAMADQPETLTITDHPLTRYIVHLLRRVQARLGATARTLASPRQHGIPDDAVKAYAKELALRVEQANTRIGVVLKVPLFRSVPPEPMSDAVLQALPDQPLFLAIHRCGQRLLNPGLAYAPGQTIYAALKNSYDLFEIIVLYRLAAQLGSHLSADWAPCKVATIKEYDLEDRPEDRTRWVWQGPHDQRLELTYQALFHSAKSANASFPQTSLSAQAVPDYVLALWKGDNIVSWLILDAKYRSGRKPVHDALGDIHRYRDSLRMGGTPAAGAYIIVPHLQDDAALYSEAYYLAAHQFGALVLYADDWAAPVFSWFRATSS